MAGASDHAWTITDHVCLACLGRVLERKGGEGEATRIFRCSNCGASGIGRSGLSHPPICACGSKVGNKDAGLRCVRNDRQRPELLSEIIVREVA